MSQVKLTNIRSGLEKPYEGYFVKYDQVHGVAVSPDSGVSISKLEDSCYDTDYKWNAACNLAFVFEDDTYPSTQPMEKDTQVPTVIDEPRKCKRLLRCKWNCKCGK